MDVIIRDETESDIGVITEITKAAFANHPYSRQTEQFIITALREAKSLTVSLVAEAEKRGVGHIAFLPVALSDGSPGWYGAGPVSVLPELQRRGIGTSLINEGLSRLRNWAQRAACLSETLATTNASASRTSRASSSRGSRRSTSWRCHSRGAGPAAP